MRDLLPDKAKTIGTCPRPHCKGKLFIVGRDIEPMAKCLLCSREWPVIKYEDTYIIPFGVVS